MKKLYRVLLVVALAAAMVLPVMAAPSPLAESKASRSNVAVPVNGATVTYLAKDVFDEVRSVLTNPTHLNDLGITGTSTIMTAFDLKYTIPSGQTSVTVPIKVTNANAGDYVVVVHRSSKAGHPYSVVGQGQLGGDKTINATFSDFSPVIVLKVSGAPATATAAGTVIKAPKTGQ